MSRRSRRGSHDSGHEGGSSERWLVSYADFITLLFAFFVVMFAISQSDLKKFKEVSESVRRAFSGDSASFAPGAVPGKGDPFNSPTNSNENSWSPESTRPSTPSLDPSLKKEVVPDPELLQIKKLLEEALELEEDLARRSEVALKGKGDQASLRWVIQDSYLPGQIAVAQDYLPLLGRVARVLQRFSERPLRLEGHADSQEGSELWKLGFERSAWIARFFEQKGVSSRSMTLASRGAGVPANSQAARDSKWGRARNRRVELWILPRSP